MSFGYFSLGFGAGGGATPRIVATGGRITEDGDYKIHTFTSNGSFEITEAPAGETVDWMVVAGGGGAGCRIGGAGGAGGMRFSFPNEDGSEVLAKQTKMAASPINANAMNMVHPLLKHFSLHDVPIFCHNIVDGSGAF